MDNQSLKEHFGEDISYEDKEILTKITTYLESNAADISNYRRSVKINNSIVADRAKTKLQMFQTLSKL